MKLIDKRGWDILTKGNFIYYQIQDEKGENSTFIKTNLNKSIEISEQEFYIIKFGVNYNKFKDLIKKNNDSSVIHEDGSIICTGFMEYIFYFIDNNGNITEKRDDIGFTNIYSFDIDKDKNIWYAIPTANYIGQYSLKENKEIYHLGEKYQDSKPLFFPEDIKIYSGFAYISDMSNNRIIKLNVKTKNWITYLEFKENVWEYRQFNSSEIVRLNSGIYCIEKK